MSYLRKIQYKIVPGQSFRVIHSCSGCGCKMHYQNTGRFRVNANGNKIDIWLIYQCEKCKHTLNLPIYERKAVKQISQKAYQMFLNNDEALAQTYGRMVSFFKKNRMEVDYEGMTYDFLNEQGTKADFQEADWIVIENPYGIPIRPERAAAEIFQISRSQVKKMLDREELIVHSGNGKLEIQVVGAM